MKRLYSQIQVLKYYFVLRILIKRVLFNTEFPIITKKHKHHGTVTEIFIYVVRILRPDKFVYITVSQLNQTHIILWRACPDSNKVFTLQKNC
jgi:hypothetical protein